MIDLVEIRVSMQAWLVSSGHRQRLPEFDEVLVRLKAWPTAPVDWSALQREAIERTCDEVAWELVLEGCADEFSRSTNPWPTRCFRNSSGKRSRHEPSVCPCPS